jgi:hypothetical protein
MTPAAPVGIRQLLQQPTVFIVLVQHVLAFRTAGQQGVTGLCGWGRSHRSGNPTLRFPLLPGLRYLPEMPVTRLLGRLKQIAQENIEDATHFTSLISAGLLRCRQGDFLQTGSWQRVSFATRPAMN